MLLFLILSFLTLELLCAAHENNFFAILGFIAYGLSLHFFTDIGVFQFIKDSINDGTIWLWILGYFCIGVLWSFIKFYTVLKSWRNKYNHHLRTWEEDGDIRKSFRDNFKRFIASEIGDLPKFSSYRNRTINWIICWPFSFIWTMVNDFFRKIGVWLYEGFNWVYKSIYEFALKGVKLEEDQ